MAYTESREHRFASTEFDMPVNGSSHAASARDRSRSPHGQQHHGICKTFNGTWGFLQSPEIDGDVFCHVRDSPHDAISRMMPGEAVKFHVVQGSSSKQNNGLTALNVQRQGVADFQEGEQHQGVADFQEGEWVTGTLTKIHGSMAFCSVLGTEGDVLLGERCLRDSGMSLMALQIGQSVSLKVVQGTKGYHATSISQLSQRWHQPSPRWQASQRVIGTVKKVHGANGFCSVPGVAIDVLLGSRSLLEAGVNLAMLQVGENLTFELSEGPKGYHAVNIQQARQQVANHGWSNGSGNRVVGTLQKSHGANGFCSVDGVADDVLLGSRSLAMAGLSLATMQVGDKLSFDLEVGPKGYHAINIQESPVGKRVVGKLKKIHGGNGFCSVEDVAEDVLLGSRSLSECGVDLQAMQIGDSLSFEMAMGPKGYSAIHIQTA